MNNVVLPVNYVCAEGRPFVLQTADFVLQMITCVLPVVYVCAEGHRCVLPPVYLCVSYEACCTTGHVC